MVKLNKMQNRANASCHASSNDLSQNAHAEVLCSKTIQSIYSKTCVKRSLKNRQNKDLNDNW